MKLKLLSFIGAVLAMAVPGAEAAPNHSAAVRRDRYEVWVIDQSDTTADGSTPGLGIVRVEQNGRYGALQAVVPITHLVNGVELADPHGIMVRYIHE